MNLSLEPGEQGLSEYQSNLERLMEIEMFARLPIEPLKLLAYLCRRETFKGGEYIFRQGEPDAQAYLIIEGTATLRLDGPDPLREYRDGDFLGGLSLLWPDKRLFSLQAATERCICLVLSRERFQKSLEQYPEALRTIVESAVAGIYKWEARFLQANPASGDDCRHSAGVSLL